MIPPDDTISREAAVASARHLQCEWCGRDDCPRWVATARLVGFSAKHAFAGSKTDPVEMQKRVDACFEAAKDPLCPGPKGAP